MSLLPCSSLWDTNIIAILGDVHSLIPPTSRWRGMRIPCYLVLGSMRLYCCFIVWIEKQGCHHYHLPRILSAFNFIWSTMWIFCGTTTVIKSMLFYFFDTFIENVPVHILLFHARVIHLQFKTTSLETMLHHSLQHFLYLKNLPYFNWTNTQELCHSQHITQLCSNKHYFNLSRLAWPQHK